MIRIGRLSCRPSREHPAFLDVSADTRQSESTLKPGPAAFEISATKGSGNMDNHSTTNRTFHIAVRLFRTVRRSPGPLTSGELAAMVNVDELHVLLR